MNHKIIPYLDEFKTQVCTLIGSIQKEYGVPITLEDQPDLQDIPRVYQKDMGNFWIALDQDTVVGTVALIDKGNHTAIIRKMFVHPQYRGGAKGVSRSLLDTLMQWAKDHGIRHLYLGTNTLLPAATPFYLKNGFRVIEDAKMPPQIHAARMPVDNLHFHMELAA